jgi:tetratricopeptide (TPR) repeat protein
LIWIGFLSRITAVFKVQPCCTLVSLYPGESNLVSLSRYLRVVLLALLATACASPGPEESAPAPIEKAPDYTSVKTIPGKAPAPAPATAAYQPLIEKAAQARQRGDFEEALALLERAQRIDADSAEIYLAMAETHSARGDAGQARAVAERGLLYCRSATQCDALRQYAR